MKTPAPGRITASGVWGPHGPRSVHCPHNQDAQQLYNTLARDGITLHDINKQLREL